ncbi:MAG TPA: imidazole glycerol phosphate synthase subunit HisF [Bacteroidota bacterium]|nr:imidazole glycerol phosphate synthase subunit HisF [Bacteroidota bacterium]
MLTKRIIPCLDVKDGRTVKGTNFLGLRDAGDAVELAARYSDEGADELVFLDISATLEGRNTFLKMVERIAEAIQIPFAVGGGLRTVEDVVRALEAGADKVSLNSAALARPEFISEASARVGAQSVVTAIDVKRQGNSWTVWTKAGTEPTGRDAIQWAKEVVERGSGELLVTSMDRDGTKSGYDLELLNTLADAVPVPVIASGGAGTKEHALDAVVRGRADAILAASIFHYGIISINELKTFLRTHKVAVRL